MKLVIYTKHAKKQMKARGISSREVIFCLEKPDKVDQEGIITIIKRKKDGFVYILITTKEEDSIKIITLYKSSKIKKYL